MQVFINLFIYLFLAFINVQQFCFIQAIVNTWQNILGDATDRLEALLV